MTDPQAIADGLSEALAYDKTGLPIKVGDVLKVFHFTGRRRKRHYMYKQVIGLRTYGGQEAYAPRLAVSHLNLKAFEDRDGGYTIPQDGSVNVDVEVVQGLESDWDERPRLSVRAIIAKEEK